MLFLYPALSLFLAIDASQTTESEACDNGEPGSTVIMKKIEGSGPETATCLTYTFEVTGPTSKNIMLNRTTHNTFQCPNGTIYIETRVCSPEAPDRCIYFNKGTCKKIENASGLLSILLGTKKTESPCQEILCNGNYQVSVNGPTQIFECKRIVTVYDVQILADGKEVGRYYARRITAEC